MNNILNKILKIDSKNEKNMIEKLIFKTIGIKRIKYSESELTMLN